MFPFSFDVIDGARASVRFDCNLVADIGKLKYVEIFAENNIKHQFQNFSTLMKWKSRERFLKARRSKPSYGNLRFPCKDVFESL